MQKSYQGKVSYKNFKDLKTRGRDAEKFSRYSILHINEAYFGIIIHILVFHGGSVFVDCVGTPLP